MYIWYTVHAVTHSDSELYNYKWQLSRLTVVRREAKKEQIESPKTKRATNYCVSFTRANVFVITTVDISRLAPTFKPAL